MKTFPTVIPIPLVRSIKVVNEQDAEEFIREVNCAQEAELHQKRVTKNTIEDYENTARLLLARCENDLGDISPVAIANWLKYQAVNWRRSTVRQYRSSINHHFTKIESGDNELEIAEAISILAGIAAGNINRSQKKKTIQEDKLVAFITFLLSSKKKSDIFLAKFLMATYMSGLRPCEWKNTYYEEITPTEIILTVRNAKNTNGRALGVSRTILLSGMIQPAIETVDEIRILMQNDSWNKIYGRLRKLCHLKSNTFFKGKIIVSPYSGRHQFSANVKNLYRKNVVALLHGHASNETATTYYGRRVSGWAQFQNQHLVAPSQRSERELKLAQKQMLSDP